MDEPTRSLRDTGRGRLALGAVVVAVVGVVLIGRACTDSVPGAVEAQYEIWQGHEPVRYSFDYGYGAAQGACMTRIAVTNGVVARVEPLKVRCDYESSALTIDAVFDQLRDSYSDGAVEAHYDLEYGFPTDVAVDPEPDTIDEEWFFVVRNFRRMTP